MGAHQGQRDFIGSHPAHDLGGDLPLDVARFNRGHQGFEHPFRIAGADRLGGWHGDPFGGNPCGLEHPFNPAAARVGNDQHSGALFAGAASAPRTVLEYFGIARGFNVDHQAQARQIDPARGDVSGNANPGALIAQGLQRVVALVLAVLTRQGDGGKAAFDQAGMKVADIVARGAEQHRRFRLVEAQQIDHRVFDVGRRNGHRLIDDIAVAAIIADGRNAQRIALIALGQRDDRLGHCR